MKELPGGTVEDIADYVLERFYLVESGGALYRYDGRVWAVQEDRAHLHKLLRSLDDMGLFYMKVDGRSGESKYAPVRVRAADFDKVIRSIRAAAFEQLNPQYAVACNNCVLAVNDTKDGIVVQDFDRDYHVTAHLPLNFDSKASPRRFLEILDRVFGSDTPDEQNRKKALLQEFYGACVFGLGSHFQKCLIMHGPGGNGKSTLQEIMKRYVFGPKTCSSVSPTRWSDAFAVIQLQDKRLNSVEELPYGKALTGDVFKQVVGGSEIEARKLYQDNVVFRPTAGHVFSTNTFPKVTDHSLGFWRRILLVSCNTPVSSGTSIDELLEELADEGPGILNWCIEGVERLLKSRQYTLPESHHRDLEEWRVGIDPIREFLRDATSREGKQRTSAGELWKAYNRWAGQTQHFTLTHIRFAERMREAGITREIRSKGNFYPVALLPDELWPHNQEQAPQEPSTLSEASTGDDSGTAS